MHGIKQFAAAAIAIIIGLTICVNVAHAEDGYGSISGQFVLDGPVPKPAVIVEKGASVKDANVCAAQDLLDESLVVHKENKGIANVFIYVRSVDKVHPDLKELPKKKKQELVLDQKGCKFIPHAMFVRTGQTVLVKSNDNCSHNTHTYPLRNKAENFILTPNFRDGVPLKHQVAEILPIKVACDIHPWMKSWWLILDHPYAAVTNEKGEFSIEKLPVGDYEFRVWHERAGYLGVGTRRGFEVKVESGKQTKLDNFLVPLEEFEEE